MWQQICSNHKVKKRACNEEGARGTCHGGFKMGKETWEMVSYFNLQIKNNDLTALQNT